MDNKLSAAFAALRKAGILAKMNVGPTRDLTFLELYNETSKNEDYCGFVGISKQDNRIRKMDNIIYPLVWGIPGRMTGKAHLVKNTILDILANYGIVVNANKFLKVTTVDMGITDISEESLIVVAENHEKFKKYLNEYFMAKRNDEERISSCKPYRPTNNTAIAKLTETKKIRRGSEFENKIVQFTGRPDRTDPINDRDIRFLEQLNQGNMDIDTFIKLT